LVTIADWDALRRAADFNPAYLHLEPSIRALPSDPERPAPDEQASAAALRKAG